MVLNQFRGVRWTYSTVFVQLMNVDVLHFCEIGRINKVTERNVCPLVNHIHKAVNLCTQYVEPVVSLLSDA